MLGDPALHRFTGGEPAAARELEARFTRWEARVSPDGLEQWLNWTVRLKDARTAAGYVQATIDAHRRAAIAYVVGTGFQRRGIASEAVTALVSWLRAERRAAVVEAHIAPGHEASERVSAAAGLRATSEADADGERIWRLTYPVPSEASG